MTSPRKIRDGSITAAFVVTLIAAVAFAAVYATDGDVRLQGGTLFVAFGGLACGLALWARRHMPQGPFVEERQPIMASAGDDRSALNAALDRASTPWSGAPVIRRMLLAAVGALTVALLFPIRSLYRGPPPNELVASTPWRDGAVLVLKDGTPVRPGDLDLETMLTVFPRGHEEAADAAAVLIRVVPEELSLEPSRLEWAVDGLVAYSKLCTHAGCPVGLYVPTTQQLMCPCHQSLFNVLDGAQPVAGPAARPLPQLPLGVNGEGFLVARGGFPAPVGPGYWSRP